MLAGLGYVAFAADIYGRGTPAENMGDWAAAAGAHRGNPDLYMSKIHAALDAVKTYDFVDTAKIAVIGYCFGGSGVVNMAILGVDVLGVVGYHSGIQTTSRVVWDSVNNNAEVKAKVLLHSGVDDDAATDVALLEQEFEAAGATYEIVRYGKDIYHSFTEWSAAFPGQAMYDHRADYRSWESTKLFLFELFMGLPAAERGPENNMLTTTMHNYTCNTTTCDGYLAYNASHCTASNKCPAVVVIQDWTGMDDYEKERARMLAGLGYVAFAADIYGRGTPAENMGDWAAAAGAHRGNPDLYMSKIHAALDAVKTYDFVDTAKIAVIGYCFGGSGVVNMAILGVDVLGVVGYHSGIQTTSRVVWDSVNNNAEVKAKVLLHSGVDDDAATDVALLEQEFEAAGATYEIVRYGKDIYHSFTEWSAAFPGQAMYDHRADYRSWESTKLFLSELFVGLPAAARAECHSTSTTVNQVTMSNAKTTGVFGALVAVAAAGALVF